MKKIFICGIILASLFFVACHSAENGKTQHVEKSDSLCDHWENNRTGYRHRLYPAPGIGLKNRFSQA